MATEQAITEALERIAHRMSKGGKWIERERLEWHRCPMLLDVEDAELEKAVSSLVAGKDTYNLDLLLSKVGKRRQARPAGDGCPICTGGMIEIAIWCGDEVTASNPTIKAIRCRCNKGGLIKDTCYAIRQADPTITDIYIAAEKVDGVMQRRFLNAEETGKAARNRMRKQGVDWPGSVPWMRPMQEPAQAPGRKVDPKPSTGPAPVADTVAKALAQMARVNR